MELMKYHNAHKNGRTWSNYKDKWHWYETQIQQQTK